MLAADRFEISRVHFFFVLLFIVAARQLHIMCIVLAG